jgi:hypothetical protein
MDHIREYPINGFTSWTSSAEPQVKYYSGVAEYAMEFTLPSGINPGDSLLLTLGNMRETAEIRLNDSLLGYAWMPDQYFHINGLLNDSNFLKVRVANVYRNRIIGDLRQYGRLQNLWTTSPVQQFLNQGMPLKESGLMGPVRLRIIRK